MTPAQRQKGKAIILGQCLMNQGTLAQRILTSFDISVPSVFQAIKFSNTNFWDHTLHNTEFGSYDSKLVETQCSDTAQAVSNVPRLLRIYRPSTAFNETNRERTRTTLNIIRAVSTQYRVVLHTTPKNQGSSRCPHRNQSKIYISLGCSRRGARKRPSRWLTWSQ